MATDLASFSLDAETIGKIERKFEQKRKLALAREDELFGIFGANLSPEETGALKFLYAYMPLNDLADYDGELFLRHVRKALEIRDRMPWGRKIPDRLFLHFVLPYRVNNENVEDWRGVFHEELAVRVSGLSMGAAILETNHWCHEKATYVGNDPRTVSPLTLVRTALGRCGEQSTLAVAALRSIGIPARQCYTPRWAHSDSNHAWVEAWADGGWHYIGACEPEPRLDQGWFSGPARRAMLVNTRVPSNYPGPEDITLAHEWYTEINLLDGYAPSRSITLRVTDAEGVPVRGALVRFQVYNYAEFTPIAKLESDERGEVSFKTGYGDLYVHACADGRFGEMKISVPEADRFELALDRLEQAEGTVDLDMVPPPEMSEDASGAVTPEERERHDARVREGAEIRKAYERTFMDEAAAAALASELGLPSERVWEVLRKARGNSHEIAAFLREFSPGYGEWPLRLLESLNDKDLTDTFRPTLADHLKHSLPYLERIGDETLFAKYVLCPRVLYEMIGPYKGFFQSDLSAEELDRIRRDPAAWFKSFAGTFEVVEDMTYYQGSATPAGSYRLRKGDRASLDILFVALCRSAGVPARLHPSERWPQFWSGGQWMNAVPVLESETGGSGMRNGSVLLLRDPDAPAETPAASYFENFSFARLENGVYKTLFYKHGKTDVYDEPFELEPGSYRLTAGTRLKDGTVLVRLNRFTVRAGERIGLPLAFRRRQADIPVLGETDRGSRFSLPDGTVQTIGEAVPEAGAVLAWIEPEREPSKHWIREAGELAGAFEALGVPLILAMGEPAWTAAFRPSGRKELPLVLALDGRGRVRYVHSGYKLGVGREVLQIFARLKETT